MSDLGLGNIDIIEVSVSDLNEYPFSRELKAWLTWEIKWVRIVYNKGLRTRPVPVFYVTSAL